MKQVLLVAAAVLIGAGPIEAQVVLNKDVKIGAMRITEIAPPGAAKAKPVVKAPAVVAAAQPAAKANPGDPKAGKANGQVVPAVGPAAAPKNPQPQARDEIEEGLNDLAEVIRSLNPSYAIAPVIGNSSKSGGSYYLRSGGVLVPGQARANGPPNRPVAGDDPNARDVAALREEIRRLREMIDKLNKNAK